MQPNGCLTSMVIITTTIGYSIVLESFCIISFDVLRLYEVTISDRNPVVGLLTSTVGCLLHTSTKIKY